MSLIDLWKSTPDQLADKQVQQLIAFAGDGKLLDGSDCSAEFRAFLARVPSEYLQTYAEQCLSVSFEGSGLALQDVVNEVGSRLGGSTTPGRYRGTVKQTGFDGLWRFPNNRSIVIEVKTTDVYSINLNTIAGYRRSLIEQDSIEEDSSSILLVVGRQETDNLEAQIRGSRHAWSVRVISVGALLRLMFIKEDVEDPSLVQRIHSMLVPHEFTRLDEIAELLFSTAQEVKQPEVELDDPDVPKEEEPQFTPVAFHEDCVRRIQAQLKVSLIKRTRTGYSSPDGETALVCAVSKEHDGPSSPNYWFAFHPHQQSFLRGHMQGYAAFGCGSAERILLVPFATFEPLLENAWTTTTRDGRTYWHVVIFRRGETYTLRLRKGQKPVDLTPFAVLVQS